MQHDVDKIIAEIEDRSYCIIPSVISPEKGGRSARHSGRLAEGGSDRCLARGADATGRWHRRQTPKSSSNL